MKASLKTLAGAMGLILFLAVDATTQSPNPGNPPASAGQTYKNIQVLKDAPAEQLVPAMQFISASLGVGCDHCHVRGGFEKDDKPAKQTARKMMQMMFAVNQNNFDGHLEVTCYSCHRGSVKPMAVPVIAEEGSAAPPAPEASPASLPDADKLVGKYIEALGGEKALRNISSRIEKGKAVLAPGREFAVEIAYKAPNKMLSTIHLQEGDMVTGSNATTGWQVTPGRGQHDLSSAEMAAGRFDSPFYFSPHIRDLFREFKTVSSEKFGNQAVYQVIARREAQPPVKLYFDQDSGLLVRMLRYEPTPVGNIPVQTDFSDYREVNGVKVPFLRATARPVRRMTLRMEDVTDNVAVQDSQFSKPAPQAATGQPGAPH